MNASTTLVSSSKDLNKEKKGDSDGGREVLKSAPPPFHTMVTLGILSLVFVRSCPSMKCLDEVATVETFTRVLFPNLINVYSLAYIRLLMALTIWWITFDTVYNSNKRGTVILPTYLPGTKLKRVPIRLNGIKALFPFTCWSWILLGISFTLNAYIAIQGTAAGGTAATGKLQQPHAVIDPWLLRVAICVWSISAPCTLLVSSVIRYAIWPRVLLAGKGNATATLKVGRVLMMHNMNSIYAVMELALMGGLPIRFSEISLLPLYGIIYVIFTWSVSMSWTDESSSTTTAGPQFIYFFFDTTLPGLQPTLALIVLLLVLLTSFGIFCVCEHVLAWLGSGLMAHLAFCIVVCGSVMRFDD